MPSERRVAIVTGAAEGIGRAVATRLAKDGLDVGVFDLPHARERLEELAADLRQAYGTRVAVVLGDVSKEEDVRRLVETVVSELGSLHAVRVDDVHEECSTEADPSVDDRERGDCDPRRPARGYALSFGSSPTRRFLLMIRLIEQ